MEMSGGVLVAIPSVLPVCPPFLSQACQVCLADTFGTENQAFTCAAGSVFVFEHSPLAQASALDRKKKRDDLLLAEQALVTLCPDGLTACTVPGIDGAYEVCPASER